MSTGGNRDISQMALRLVILLGLVSLFADVTYEGARSIIGPFFAFLGASATVVGFVAGFGELVGYALRLFSGYFTDRTQKYWTIIISGYVVNLLAVPLLALTGRWETAAILLIVERMGKAIRTPARDAILSHATTRMGRGFGFGLHEALDQIGAVLGPLFITASLAFHHNYRLAFASLFLPALFALLVLSIARAQFPHPGELEPQATFLRTKGLPPIFWRYLFAIALITAGYADFALIAYHWKKQMIMAEVGIPLVYAIAMGTDAVSALFFGRLFDRYGIRLLALTTFLSTFFAPLVFLGSFPYAFAGIALWGIGMGAQESIMRAGIADMVPVDKRGTAYGIFHTGYGLFWFLGSFVMGMLYDISPLYLIIFSVVLQLASIPLLLQIHRR